MIQSYPTLFFSNGAPLVGRFYRNTQTLFTRQPAVIVTGSWLTVKEQMPAVYAERLTERGYTAFTFDFAGFGESGGVPAQAEIPTRKISDILSAASFVSTMSFMKPGAIGHLGVCASAQYTLAALAASAAIRSFVSVAGWYHDTVSVAQFYGGEEGVRKRVENAKHAIEKFVRTGEVEKVPAYNSGDESAGIFFELDYYGNSKRGAVPTWRNEMATMSWFHWLTFDGLQAAPQVKTPTLFVHSDGCVFPDNVKRIHSALTGPKEMVWMDGTQTDFYDQPQFVEKAIDTAHRHFSATL
jgi:dienelactone hydrolase